MTTLLFALFCILQAADIFTTWRVLRAGGVERNPLLARPIARFGVLPTLLAVKAAIIAAIALVQVPVVLLALVNLVYVAVVVNNVRAMVR